MDSSRKVCRLHHLFDRRQDVGLGTVFNPSKVCGTGNRPARFPNRCNGGVNGRGIVGMSLSLALKLCMLILPMLVVIGSA